MLLPSERLPEFIRETADALWLQDWIFAISKDPPLDKDSILEVEPLPGRRVAIITATENFAKKDYREQQHAVIHELIHCHMQDVQDFFRQDLAPLMTKREEQILWQIGKRHIEHAVDGLADAFESLVAHLDAAREKGAELEQFLKDAADKGEVISKVKPDRTRYKNPDIGDVARIRLPDSGDLFYGRIVQLDYRMFPNEPEVAVEIVADGYYTDRKIIKTRRAKDPAKDAGWFWPGEDQDGTS